MSIWKKLFHHNVAVGLFLGLYSLTASTTSGSDTEWKKHVVHTGFHTSTAVAADFTGDGKPDIISNSAGKTRLFVAPDWKQIILNENPQHNCIHSEVIDEFGTPRAHPYPALHGVHILICEAGLDF